MNKYILYARVASKTDAIKSETAEHQISTLEKFALDNGLVVGKIISDISSTQSNRPGFNEMINLLNQKNIKGLSVCNLTDYPEIFNL